MGTVYWKVAVVKESVHTLEFATIGDVLKKYRKQSNLSISQLARLTGVHKGVIAKIENGSTRRPGLKITMPLAKVLNIPTDKIVELYIEIDKRPEVLFGLLRQFGCSMFHWPQELLSGFLRHLMRKAIP